MRPGDVALGVTMASPVTGNPSPVTDNLHVCAVKKANGAIAVNMLNKADAPCSFTMQIAGYNATIDLPANCVETIEISL